MDRGAKPAKAKVVARRAVAGTTRVSGGANVHQLETRLQAALEQQAATSEILRVMADSPSDVQPVLDAVAERAANLCKAPFARVFLLDGDALHCVADFSADGADPIPVVPVVLKRTTISGRAVLEGKVVHIADVVPLLDREFRDARENARLSGFRAALAVPLVRETGAYGAIFLWRREPGLFAPDQVALVQTFARQAAIAIENARLFEEVSARNSELSEALERQNATSEVLRAIASSPTDIQPVLESVVRAAARFCGAPDVALLRLDGEVLRGAAAVGAFGEVLKGRMGRIDALEMPLNRDSVSGRAVIERRSVHVHDLAAESEDDYPTGRELQRRFGHRTMLAVPLLRESEAIGVIDLFRTKVEPFSDKQVELLRTFADQAVIAIENVRLFNEVNARNRDLTEALEQQMATSEILRAISSSPTDVQPVFDIIGESAEKLCDAEISVVSRIDGELIRLVALHGVSAEGRDAIGRHFPMQLDAETVTARSIRRRAVVHIADALTDTKYESKDAALAGGYRACLGVPMLREGEDIGSIFVARKQPGLFTDSQVQLLKTFADQAVIAIENVRLFTELEVRNHDLTETLEQQTATSEILRAISGSPTDVQPVFDTIVAAALKLCGASSANLVTYDGTLVHVAAFAPMRSAGADAVRRHFESYPRPPSRDTANTRAILTRSVVEIADVLEDQAYAAGPTAVAAGYRSVLSVPLMREENPIGAITVARANPGPFPEKQITLLETFADQAVIAIENVRLFTALEARNHELTEALEQQTATSEILRAISSSPTDVQPVFDIIAQRAGKLCDAEVAVVSRFDGRLIELAAIHGLVPEGVKIVRTLYPMPIDAQTVTARVIRGSTVVHIADVLAEQSYGIKDFARAAQYRGGLGVPIVRNRRVIGSIFVGRARPGLFTDAQVQLLKTFADQAVIAIENVRLFTELEVRNHDLTEALEQQTATSEILRVISQSRTDVQPVFETIAAAALRLCRASVANLVTLDGDLMRMPALANVTPEGADALRRAFPRPVGRDTGAGRAIVTCDVVAIPDVLDEPGYGLGGSAGVTGFRSVVAVPLVRDGKPIGAINIGRLEPGSFADNEIALLRTFADQAVIAIENVRLFKELEARTTQLTRSVGELKALGEVGQAVGSTLDLATVLRTIASRATELAGMDGGAIYEYDEARETFHLHTTDRLPGELVDALRSSPIPKGEGALGKLAVTGEPVEIRDIMDAGIYQSRVREILLRLGYRALLAVPLLREDHLLGGLVVNRRSAGAFAPEVIALLKTFATQSALAIQNARLFREIEDKGRQLEIASRHKSEFLANMSHELRTPLNAIIGFSEVLAERMFGEINDKQAEYLADILESGRHLLSLINDILDLSKIEAGRMELERSDFSLPSAIDNTMTLVRERAHRRGIVLERRIDAGVGKVNGDERKVKQVLLNLLSNALKFTADGGRIAVHAEVRDRMTEISVTDTGVGIAPGDLEAVFEEFRQVGSASKKVEGTGLGLAISRKFIELHGGRIWATSQVGVGSTFAFTLPVPAADGGRLD